MDIIYLITMSAHHDYIGIPQNFEPEAFKEESKALERLAELENDNSEWSGVYYVMEQIKLV